MTELDNFTLVDISQSNRGNRGKCPAERHISEEKSKTSQTELPILVTTNNSTIEKIVLSPEEKLLTMQHYLPYIKEALPSLIALGMCANQSDIDIHIRLSHNKKTIFLYGHNNYYLGEYLLPSLEIEIPKERSKPVKKGGEK